MNRIRIATFNLAWFGTAWQKMKTVWELTPKRLQLVSECLALLDADIIVLQEICNPEPLASIDVTPEKWT